MSQGDYSSSFTVFVNALQDFPPALLHKVKFVGSITHKQFTNSHSPAVYFDAKVIRREGAAHRLFLSMLQTPQRRRKTKVVH